MPRSALTEALAKSFGGQALITPQTQGAPAATAGQAEPGPTDTPDQAPANAIGVQPTDAEGQPAAEAEEDPNAAPTDELPQGDTPEPELAAEPEPEQETELETGTEPDGDTELTGLPIGVQKRLNKLLGQVAQLKAQLANGTPSETAPPAAAANRGPGPLDAVMDSGELDRREAITEDGLAEVDDLMARLPVQPALVERFLRHAKIQLQDENGQEDYSTERMLNWLAGVRAGFTQTLRAIPKRRAFLGAYASEHAKAVQLFPWLAQKTDQRHALAASFLAQAPALRSAPNHEYWLGCAINGHLALQAQLAKANGTQPPNGARGPVAKPKARLAPNTGTNPTAGPRSRPDQVKIGAARQKVLNEGSKAALSEFLQATNFLPGA